MNRVGDNFDCDLKVDNLLNGLFQLSGSGCLSFYGARFEISSADGDVSVEIRLKVSF